MRDSQIAFFEADACAVVIRYSHVLENETGHIGIVSAQDQSGLALAGSAIEDHVACIAGEIGHRTALLHGAFAVRAPADGDTALPVTDRVDGLLERAEALPGFDHGKRSLRRLREQCGSRDQCNGRRRDGAANQK